MTGCAICMNPFHRNSYDRIVRIGYGYDFPSDFISMAALVVTPVKKDRQGGINQVKVCTQCRYDLMGALRRWIVHEFPMRVHRPIGGRITDGGCPICNLDLSGGEYTLKVSGVPGLEVLHKIEIENSFACLTTCYDCRQAFVELVLSQWLAGEFIADGRWINWETRSRVRMWREPLLGGRLSWVWATWPKRDEGKLLPRAAGH